MWWLYLVWSHTQRWRQQQKIATVRAKEQALPVKKERLLSVEKFVSLPPTCFSLYYCWWQCKMAGIERNCPLFHSVTKKHDAHYWCFRWLNNFVLSNSIVPKLENLTIFNNRQRYSHTAATNTHKETLLYTIYVYTYSKCYPATSPFLLCYNH